MGSTTEIMAIYFISLSLLRTRYLERLRDIVSRRRRTNCFHILLRFLCRENSICGEERRGEEEKTASRVVFDRNRIFLFRPITIFGKNGILADNIGQNAEYRLFRPVLYMPISGKTGILAHNIGRQRVSV